MFYLFQISSGRLFRNVVEARLVSRVLLVPETVAPENRIGPLRAQNRLADRRPDPDFGYRPGDAAEAGQVGQRAGPWPNVMKTFFTAVIC
jgi:hypothetical protein